MHAAAYVHNTFLGVPVLNCLRSSLTYLAAAALTALGSSAARRISEAFDENARRRRHYKALMNTAANYDQVGGLGLGGRLKNPFDAEDHSDVRSRIETCCDMRSVASFGDSAGKGERPCNQSQGCDFV
jgi:hypothetical protein